MNNNEEIPVFIENSGSGLGVQNDLFLRWNCFLQMIIIQNILNLFNLLKESELDETDDPEVLRIENRKLKEIILTFNP